MKQPLFLTEEAREACARAFLVRTNTTKLAARALPMARGYVMRAETYLMTVWARAAAMKHARRVGLAIFSWPQPKHPERIPEVMMLTITGHRELVELCRACGHPDLVAALLADVAFGVAEEVNPPPASASE